MELVKTVYKTEDVRYYRSGGEADVYLIGSDPYVAKVYKSPTKLATLKNKAKKLKLISDNGQLPDWFVRPLDIHYWDGKLFSHDMDFIDGEDLHMWCSTIEERRACLLEVKEKLFQLYDLGIGYFDLGAQNIVRDFNGKLFFIDVCNCQVGDYEPDLMTIYLSLYISRGGKLDKRGLKYVYNWFCYLMLSNDYDYDFDVDKMNTLPLTKESKEDVKSFCKTLFSGKTDNIADCEFLSDYIVMK